MEHGTQKLLAEKTNISKSLINEIVNGKKRASRQTAKQLIRAVPGTTYDLWFEGSPEEIQAAIAKVPWPITKIRFKSINRTKIKEYRNALVAHIDGIRNPGPQIVDDTDTAKAWTEGHLVALELCLKKFNDLFFM